MTTPLSRFQRVLLATDGTVTTILEAYADEPIEVFKLLQYFDRSDIGDAALLLTDDRVLRRRVLIRGRRTQRSFLYAEAVVALDRVDPTILDGLFTTDKPIGVLLAEARLETFREILGVQREPAGQTGAYFGVDAGAEVLSRTYRIMAGGRPVILITEKHLASAFRDEIEKEVVVSPDGLV